MNRAQSNRRVPFSRRILLASTALVAAGAMAAAPLNAHAENAWVLSQEGGSFDTDTSVNNLTTITQHTDRAYGVGDLDIQAYQTVNIHQNNSGSLFIARDNKNDPTQILGALNANGNVMIIDRNGVFFGEGSRVDVNGIIASTGDVDVDAVMNGANVMEFSNFGEGTIELKGEISVADAGLAAFVSPTVKNSGVINAKLGRVAFAAGEKVTLDLYGDRLVEIEASEELESALLENAGTINAEGGVVQMTARAANDAVDNVINMSGIVNASSVTQKGGKIILDGGNSGTVAVAGTLDASGTEGGDVEIDGQNTHLAATSTVDVSSTDKENGQAGSAVMWGRENAIYAGTVDARGKGAFVETSGGNLGVQGDVLVGEGAEWLLDPTNILIVGSSNLDDSDVDLGQNPFSPADPVDGVNDGNDGLGNEDSNFWIFDGLINSALNSGADVRIQTNAAGTNEGDITVRADAAIVKSAGGGSKLTLEAHDDIIIDGTITQTGGTWLDVDLIAGYAGGNPDADIIINNTIDVDAGLSILNLSATNQIDVNAEIASFLADFDAPTVNLSADVVSSGIGGNATTVNVLNDTAQIQDGVDAGGTGADIYVSAGTFNESVSAYKEGQTIYGASAGTAGYGVRAAETIINPNSPGIHITADGVVVDGVMITGATGADGYGIWVDGADNVTLKNNIITDVSNDGVHINDADSVNVENNWISDVDTQGFDSGNGVEALDSSNITVLANLIEDTKWDGVRLEFVDGATVENNVVDGVQRVGIYGRDVSDVLIEGNVARNTIEYQGINVLRGADVSVIANAVDHTNLDGIWVRYSSDVDIIDNEVGLDGGNIGEDGIEVLGSHGAHISLNKVNDTVANGIYVHTSNGTTVSGSTITNAGAHGILVNPSSNVTVAMNTIDSVAEDGVHVSGGSMNTVRQNYIGTLGGDDNIGDDGVHIEGSFGAKVTGNVITNTVMHGVHLNPLDDGDSYSDDAYVGDNFISYAGGDGVHAYDAYDLEVDGNLINNIAGNGVYVETGSETVVTSNHISTVGQNGIYILDEQSEGDAEEVEGFNIRDNYIGNAAFDGIKVRDFYAGWIANNHVGFIDFGEVVIPTGVGDDGIDVKGGDYISIYGNEIFGAGFYLDGANVSWSGADGIRVKDVGGLEFLPPLAGLEEDGFGYGFAGADVEIFGNTIAFTQDDGIEVIDGNRVHIESNVLGHIGLNTWNADGIRVTDSAHTVIKYNGVADVLDDGIRVDGGFYAGVFGNNVLRVGDEGIEISNIHYEDDMPTDIAFADIDYPTTGYPVSVEGNEVVLSGDHGIFVHDSGATRIINNQVSFAGVGEENVYEAVNDVANDINDMLNDGPVFDTVLVAEIVEDIEPSFTLEWGDGDGIKVENVYRDEYDLTVTAETAEVFGPGVDGGYSGYFDYSTDGWSVLIQGNQVGYTGGDGIDVNEAGTTLIGGYDSHSNNVYQAGIDFTTIMGAESFAEWTESGPFLDELEARRVVWLPGEGEWSDEWVSVGDYGELSSALNPYLTGGISYIGHDTHDGIRATNIYNNYFLSPEALESSASAGFSGGFYGYALNIVGNTVDTTGDDGIEAGWVTSALIKDNYVVGAGVGSDYGMDLVSTEEDYRINYGAGDYYGADGISAHNIYGERGIEAGSYAGDDYEEYALVIDGNIIDGTADDGIEVASAGRTLISYNTVSNNGVFGEGYQDVEDEIDMYDYDGPHIPYGTAGDGFGADGIHARDVYDHTYHFGYDESFDPETGYTTETYTYTYGADTAVDINNNTVDVTGDDGIEVLDSGRTVIDLNTITHAGYGGGYYYGAADGWGADGIHVRNVIGGGYVESDVYVYDHDGYYGYYTLVDSYYEEQDLYNVGTSVEITNNFVDTTADDGIQVLFSGNSVIDLNEVYNAGYGDGGSYEGEGDYDGNGADGIHVQTGFLDSYYGGDDPKLLALAAVEAASDDYFLSTSTVITNNIVNTAADDGIDVEGVTDVLVDNNDVDNVLDDGIEVVGYFGDFDGSPGDVFFEDELIATGTISEVPFFTATISNNTVDYADNNGIEVSDLDEFFIQDNVINNVGLGGGSEDDEFGGHGIEAIFYGNGQITGNIINHAGNDGIFTDGYNDAGVGYSILISGNDIDDVGVHGIDVNYTDLVIITDNEVSNAGEIGILGDYANGSVMFTGNTMTDNPIGAAFNSGVVNMIGDSNTFNNGQVGLQFNGPDVSLTDNDPLDEFEGSIGTSVFSGQSQYFVELTEGALFEPGQPSIYNALDSSYFLGGSFFSPSDTGGIITPAQLTFLEDMFQHYNDDDTLGLFFFGALSLENLEDFFNTFGTFDGNVTGASVTITGLPTTSQQQTALLLNNLTPAAGGEGGIPGDTNGDGELSAEEAAALDPAAGGEEVNCWNDALNGLEGGATVNYSFDTSFESALADTAGCGIAQAQ